MTPRQPSENAYDQDDEFVAMVDDQPVRVMTKPGRSHRRQLEIATTFLADAVGVAADARILLLGCEGALGVVLGRRADAGELWLVDTDYLALRLAQQSLAANGVSNVHVCFDPAQTPVRAGSCENVVLHAPPDRALARRWLAEAHAALRPGGMLWLGGANNEGIRSIIADAEALFGNAVLLDVRQRHRVARSIKDEAADRQAPAWSWESGIVPGTWHTFDVTVDDEMFHLKSLPGVFSYDRLDAGTALLLSNLVVPRQGRVLDVGCGYGLIGLVAARRGAAHVDMVDVNLFAVAAARENIAAGDVPSARALPSDLYSAVSGERYDLIVTNPPFHVGKAVDYAVAEALIARAPAFLAPGGRLVLVANAFIRYERLLRRVSSEVVCLAATKHYQVLSATGVSSSAR